MTTIINNYALTVREYQGERVITFKDVDRVHERAAGTARRNFNANRDNFIENTDYYEVNITNDEIRRQFGAGKNAGRTIILLTEFGYLLLVKSLTDKLAWRVQRELIKGYFRAKEHQLNENYPLLDRSVYRLQEFENRATNELLHNAYEIGELKAKYATAQAEIKALKSQASRVEKNFNSYLNTLPIAVTYFADVQALYNNMSDIYQSFAFPCKKNGIKSASGSIVFRFIEFDGKGLIFRRTKYDNIGMYVDNINKVERIDNNMGVSIFRIYLKGSENVYEIDAARKLDLYSHNGYKEG